MLERLGTPPQFPDLLLWQFCVGFDTSATVQNQAESSNHRNNLFEAWKESCYAFGPGRVCRSVTGK
jgi:hypothetical protein